MRILLFSAVAFPNIGSWRRIGSLFQQARHIHPLCWCHPLILRDLPSLGFTRTPALVRNPVPLRLIYSGHTLSARTKRGKSQPSTLTFSISILKRVEWLTRRHLAPGRWLRWRAFNCKETFSTEFRKARSESADKIPMSLQRMSKQASSISDP